MSFMLLLKFDVHSRTLKAEIALETGNFWVKIPKTSVIDIGDEKVIFKFEYLVQLIERAAVSSRLFRGKFSDHVLAGPACGCNC